MEREKAMANTMFKELSLKILEERPNMVKAAGHYLSITRIILVTLYLKLKTSKQKFTPKSQCEEPRVNPSLTWIFKEVTVRLFS